MSPSSEKTLLSPHLTSSGPTSETWEARSASMTFRWKARVLEIVIVGHGASEFGAALIRRQDTQLAEAGSLNLFYDFANMPTYDSDLRVACTKWIQAHSNAVRRVHVVVKSKMVAMGVSVANLALGGIIQTYTQRTGAFEQEIERASR